MSFHLFGRPEDALRLKAFSATSRGIKTTIRIELETSDPWELSYTLEGLAKVKAGQSSPKSKSKPLALPAPGED